VSVQPARRIALEVITAVREDDAYANLLLPVKLERARLDPVDASLATELAYGTLRMQGYYDAVIAIAADRAIDRVDPLLLDILQLGAHQLLSMRVAEHAAVNESVELARQVAGQSATGFVNGVLRGIARIDADGWRERVLQSARSDDERMSLVYSHPVWVLRAFRRALAADGRAHELEALLAADNAAPRVGLVALPGLASVDDISGADPALYSPFAAINDGGDPSGRAIVRSGKVRVQDEGSQLAALALSRARPVTPGERWLDLCAGPGGKAALLAAEAGNGGALLTANEVTPARADLVRQSLRVFADPPEVLVRDGRDFGVELPGEFDRVLLDAPCTGLGALRRRPEARWRKQPSDVPELARLQAELLASGLETLAPGGVLAYVTCSPHLAETRAVLDEVLDGRTDVTPLDTAAVLAGVTTNPLSLGDRDHGHDRGHVQLWPHAHGTDAMFISLLQRRP
jgi:16S rRNA (cytosine967-C5)-methyltransferase